MRRVDPFATPGTLSPPPPRRRHTLPVGRTHSVPSVPYGDGSPPITHADTRAFLPIAYAPHEECRDDVRGAKGGDGAAYGGAHHLPPRPAPFLFAAPVAPPRPSEARGRRVHQWNSTSTAMAAWLPVAAACPTPPRRATRSSPVTSPSPRQPLSCGARSGSGSRGASMQTSRALLLRARLRRRHVVDGTADAAKDGAAASASSPETSQHPLELLQHWGSGVFNDAPLESFLAAFPLQRPVADSGRRESATRRTPAAARNSQKRSEAERYTCSVHLGDVEARTLRVCVRSTADTALFADLVKAIPPSWRRKAGTDVDAENADAKGEPLEFVLHPLALFPVSGTSVTGGDGTVRKSQPPPMYTFARGKVFSRHLPPTSPGVVRNVLGNGFVVPSPPPKRRSAPHSIIAADESVPSVLQTRHGTPERSAVVDAPPSPPHTPYAVLTVDSTRRSSYAPAPPTTVSVTRGNRQQNVEGWKRYSVGVALYVALAESGFCDLDSLPFLALQRTTWGQLVGRCETRLELLACGSAAARQLLRNALHHADEEVPVAVSVPIARKGVLRRAVDARRGHASGASMTTSTQQSSTVFMTSLGGPHCPVATSTPSLTTQPFTDAEVFQLFYLQLVFRSALDIRFPAMTVTVVGTDGQKDRQLLRSDLIGVRTYPDSGIAFQHPTQRERWVLFPAPSRVLTLLNLDAAVIPLYATATELAETTQLPLFGASDDLPCIGRVGEAALKWAAAQHVHSPSSALFALQGLFDQFTESYGCDRRELWSGPAHPPKVFRSAEESAFAALRARHRDLSRFFVPPERRAGESARAADCLSTLHPAHFTPLSRPPAADAGATTTTTTALSNDSSTALVHSVTLCPQPPPLHRPLDLEEKEKEDEEVGGQDVGRSPLGGTTLHAEAAEEDHRLLVSSSFSVLTHVGATTEPAVPPHTECGAGSSGSAAHLTFHDTSSRASVVADAEVDDAAAAAFCTTSPFTMQENLVSRWRHYASDGDIAFFDGATEGIELLGLLGRGGSGLVYRGRYGRRHLPVAVKVFIIPDGMSHESYVRESLTDLAFYVLLNQLDDFAICAAGRAHDFIVSATPPRGLPEKDGDLARRGADPATTKLCYFVTDLMDGTLGSFLTEDDEDYDPCYDTIVNSPLRDGELFQLLFTQLVMKSVFDWRVLDLMLNGQLRGDNLGYRYLCWPTNHPRSELDEELWSGRSQYRGIIVQYQFSLDVPLRYLRFPVFFRGGGDGDDDGSPSTTDPLKVVYFIDLGQGMQPNVANLTRRHLIGETVVDSCVTDDGFGRYWPLDELYCKDVEVAEELGKAVVRWGAELRISTHEDTVAAMEQLFALFEPVYGVSEVTEEDTLTHILLTWSPARVSELKKFYVYRPE